MVVCGCALSVLALFGGASGCAAGSTTDDGPILQDASPTDPGNSQTLPPGSSSPSGDGDETAPQGDAGVVNKPKADGGAKQQDGGITIVDAGPPLPPSPNPGDTCTTHGEIVKRSCGYCGTQQTICSQNPDGSLTWASYDDCAGTHGECVAGDTGIQACNNCGTRTVTCSAQCVWTTGACSAAAGTGCVPGSWDLTTAGCPTGSVGQYRVRQCSDTCMVGTYTDSCEGPPTTIEVGPSVGSISSTIAILSGQVAKIDQYGDCPLSSLSSTLAAYAYTQVHNPLAVAATVDIYNSAAPNSTAVTQTQITAYDSDVPPVSPDARKQCLHTSQSGSSATTGSYGLASLDGDKKIKIPAGQTVIVFTNSRNSASGPIKVNVKLEALGGN